ncbi:hypothetical protein ACFP3U_36510 [Kitasatospora misakiensis]|uniref:Uncharacterized protein n=1 Tax=Kitasatospora misakiensis TaxID=67330 RepID=A0ABW0XH57_9ACTN
MRAEGIAKNAMPAKGAAGRFVLRGAGKTRLVFDAAGKAIGTLGLKTWTDENVTVRGLKVKGLKKVTPAEPPATGRNKRAAVSKSGQAHPLFRKAERSRSLTTYEAAMRAPVPPRIEAELRRRLQDGSLPRLSIPGE